MKDDFKKSSVDSGSHIINNYLSFKNSLKLEWRMTLKNKFSVSHFSAETDFKRAVRFRRLKSILTLKEWSILNCS